MGSEALTCCSRCKIIIVDREGICKLDDADIPLGLPYACSAIFIFCRPKNVATMPGHKLCMVFVHRWADDPGREVGW